MQLFDSVAVTARGAYVPRVAFTNSLSGSEAIAPRDGLAAVASGGADWAVIFATFAFGLMISIGIKAFADLKQTTTGQRPVTWYWQAAVLTLPVAVVLYAAARLIGHLIGPTLTGLATLALLVSFFWFVLIPLVGIMEADVSLSIRPVASREFGGFMLAATIGLSAIVLSLPLGVLLALARQSDLPLIKWSAIVFIEVVRGVPLIVWLFTAQLLLNYFLPPGTSFDLTLRVIIMVTLFAAAYIAEVIRGGLAALPNGQYEGAGSLGLSYWQLMRLIILPQALKISIPGIVNEFIGLFKDTTHVVFIGLLDPIGVTRAIRATPEWNGIYWELFIFVGLLFYVVCYAMARYSLHLQNLLRRDNH
ncbi:amino acid ABC transporter permease [uncultured Tateyamaria sp.]|uniref:amino acid ABC transporter permease n=1 Tax=uncultured Tateyamaria sp. TaxID=455651 RepID=UPI00262BF57E|nr:amino acid ABC transporter permease [uncultured Tateyamaria sp.]